jgi:uncharacterized paraquat-inducible protein A
MYVLHDDGPFGPKHGVRRFPIYVIFIVSCDRRRLSLHYYYYYYYYYHHHHHHHHHHHNSMNQVKIAVMIPVLYSSILISYIKLKKDFISRYKYVYKRKLTLHSLAQIEIQHNTSVCTVYVTFNIYSGVDFHYTQH